MLSANINSINIISKPNAPALLSDINFTLLPNNIYTIIGNNGSGKSTLLLALMNLLNKDSFIIDGAVTFNDANILALSEDDFASIRKENFRFVFQDPISSLNPLKKIKYYFELSNFSISDVEEELDYFQLPEYSKISQFYPHQLSTGMAQRINVVLALLSNPNILLLDEPTSALDLPIINLLLLKFKEYVKQENKIILLITQDVPFGKVVSNYIAKMEKGTLQQFFSPEIFFKKENI